MMHRHQVITWTNDDPLYQSIYVSSGLNELREFYWIQSFQFWEYLHWIMFHEMCLVMNLHWFCLDWYANQTPTDEYDARYCPIQLLTNKSKSEWNHPVDVYQTDSIVMTHNIWSLHAHTWVMHAPLTHWGRVTHICVSKLTIIGSDNGLSPGWRQAIIWTNAGILLIGTLRTNFSEILGKIN